MVKATAIIFDTDFTATIADVNVEGGTIKHGEYEWVADKTTPFSVSNNFGMSKPLYLLKWNSILPMNFEVENEDHEFTDKDGKPIKFRIRKLSVVEEPKWNTKGRILPEMLQQTGDMRFLKQMKMASSGSSMDKNQLVKIIIIALGGLLGFMLFSGGGIQQIQSFLGF